MSVVERDHIIALMRELNPKRPFSRPESLYNRKINIFKKNNTIYKNIAKVELNSLKKVKSKRKKARF